MVIYGPYYPSYVTGNTATGIDWTDPENAQGVEGEDYAFCYFFSEGANSAPLCGYDFGMEIPENETILGIKVEVLKSADSGDFLDWANSGYGARLLRDHDDTGTRFGNDLGREGSYWPQDAFEWVSYGGENDLWGTSDLTAADLNSSLFGFEISALADQAGGTAMVKAIRITIYLADPAVLFSVAQPASPIGGSFCGEVLPTSPHAGATGQQRPAAPH